MDPQDTPLPEEPITRDPPTPAPPQPPAPAAPSVSDDPTHAGMHPVGAAVGAVSGAAAGALGGIAAGPLGSLAGAALGALAGGMLGSGQTASGPSAVENVPSPATPEPPGDEAAPGTPGSGEAVCPACGGRGRIEGADTPCPRCSGTGKVTQGVGGG